MRRPAVVVLGILLTAYCLPLTARAAALEHHEGLPVVFLSGTPYERGRQHGEVLREEVRASVSQVLGYFRRYLKIPWVRSWLVNGWLDRAWRQAAPFVARESLEELRGLSEGSGVPLKELHRLHAIPDRTYACSSFAAWGRATKDGRLLHGRNLDWTIESGIQRFAAVFVIRAEGRHALVSVGWIGFIGALTGINDAQLSIGQIGAETTEATFRGEPMAFLMRRVLEEAATLEEAAVIVQRAPRTVGVNYVIADAKARRAIVLETTHRQARVFTADDSAEHAVAYARPMRDAVCRADTAMDATIRERQLASGGDPSRPGLEPPSGSAYEVRYLGQAERLQAHMGRLDAEGAKAIAQAVAPGSNVQSVVFAWPDVWIANADGLTPAAQTRYVRLSLDDLFTRR